MVLVILLARHVIDTIISQYFLMYIHMVAPPVIIVLLPAFHPFAGGSIGTRCYRLMSNVLVFFGQGMASSRTNKRNQEGTVTDISMLRVNSAERVSERGPDKAADDQIAADRRVIRVADINAVVFAPGEIVQKKTQGPASGRAA